MLTDITATSHALAKVVRTVRPGPRAAKDDREAYDIARAIVLAIRDGKVPLLKLDDDNE